MESFPFFLGSWTIVRQAGAELGQVQIKLEVIVIVIVIAVLARIVGWVGGWIK